MIIRRIILLLLIVIGIVCQIPSSHAQDTPDVLLVEWSPDGTMLLVGGTDGRLQVAQPDSTLIFAVPDMEGDIGAIAWSPDSTKFAATDDTYNVTILNVNDPNYAEGELIATFVGHEDRIRGLAWSPDNSSLVSVTREERFTFRAWDLDNQASEPVLERPVSNLLGAEWSPDGSQLALASEVGVFLFDASLEFDQSKLADYFHGEFTYATAIEWNTEGDTIAVGKSDGQIYFLNAETKEIEDKFRAHQTFVTDIEWSPDGAYFASIGLDRLVRIWEAKTGEKVVEFYDVGVQARSVSWRPDGAAISYGGLGGTVVTRSLDTKTVSPEQQKERTASTLTWNNDGTLIAIGFSNGLVQIVDPESSEVFVEYTAHLGRITDLDWSPDGTHIASSNYGRDPRTTVFNLETGQEEYSYQTDWLDVLVVAWSPDGKYLLTGAAEPARANADTFPVLDAKSGERVASLGAGTPSDVEWSPDESLIAIGHAGGDVNIFDAATFELVSVLKGEDSAFGGGNQLTDVEWSRDGRLVVSGTMGGKIRVWNTETGQQLHVLNEQPEPDAERDPIQLVLFSVDGTSFISLSVNGRLRTWDTETGSLLEEAQFDAPILTSAVTPDKTRVAYVSSNGKIELYQLTFPE